MRALLWHRRGHGFNPVEDTSNFSAAYMRQSLKMSSKFEDQFLISCFIFLITRAGNVGLIVSTNDELTMAVMTVKIAS